MASRWKMTLRESAGNRWIAYYRSSSYPHLVVKVFRETHQFEDGYWAKRDRTLFHIAVYMPTQDDMLLGEYRLVPRKDYGWSLPAGVAGQYARQIIKKYREDNQ